MKNSESVYDDVFDVDDPVAETERTYRREFLEDPKQTKKRERLYGGGEDEDMSDTTRSIDNTVDMAADVLKSEALQEAIASLITRVLESKQFQEACQTLLKNLWNDLINDPETTAQVIELLNNAIQHKQIQRSVRKLVLNLIQDPEVYDELTRLLVRLGKDNEVCVVCLCLVVLIGYAHSHDDSLLFHQVLEATQNLLTESAHNALNDPEILDHSMEFATDVVGDDIVQRTSGEALRNTVTYAVRPSLSNCETNFSALFFVVVMMAELTRQCIVCSLGGARGRFGLVWIVGICQLAELRRRSCHCRQGGLYAGEKHPRRHRGVGGSSVVTSWEVAVIVRVLDCFCCQVPLPTRR